MRCSCRNRKPATSQTSLMPERRIATVRPVPEEEATGKVADVYADIRKTKGIDFIPNFWRVLATNPDQLEIVWARLKAIMHPESEGRAGELDPVVRELIALAVSATNGCSYCINSHTAAAKKLGVTDAALGEALAVAALFNSTNALADGYQVESDVFPTIDD